MRWPLLATVLLGLAGCSLLTDLDPFAAGGGPAEGAYDASPNASTAASDGAPGESDPDAAVSAPPPPPPCDPNTPPAAGALFVSTTGDDALAGTAAAPLKSIASALELAKANGMADVYLDEGTYAEAVTIASPTTLHGGWKAEGASWVKDCSAAVVGRTILRSPTVRAVGVSGFSGSAGLDTLTLVTKAQAATGESGIAVLVSGDGIVFTMTGVDVAAATAGDGMTPAAPAAAGNASCYGSSSDGAKGPAGKAGTPAEAGTFSAAGYVTTTGGAGGVGAPGRDGTPGSPSGFQDLDCITSCGPKPGCASGPNQPSSGGTGTAGCRGLGGTGGQGGTSGGASVGVLVFGAKLSVDHSIVRASRGGNGAPGAGGGAGGAGTPGKKGTELFCGGSCFYSGSNDSCMLSGTSLPGGGAGGPGGAGGAGGAGGGGAGGPSYGIVVVGGGDAQVATTTAIHVMEGGAGAGGAPNGASAPTFGL